MKKCPGCLEIKELTDFYVRKNGNLRSRCRMCTDLENRAYALANPNSVRIHKKKYVKANYQKTLAVSRKSRKIHSGKANAFTAKRRAALLQRTPKWLTKEQLKDIEQFYIEAKELQWLSNEPLEVDHEIPLQGDNVSGLHVPWNLQILPKSLNASKSNK